MFIRKIRGLTPVPVEKYAGYMGVEAGTHGEIHRKYAADAVYFSTHVIVMWAHVEIRGSCLLAQGPK